MILFKVYNHLLYLVYWIVNAGVLYVVGKLFPAEVMLGVNKFNALEAAIYAGFWMSFVVWTCWDLLIARKADFGSGWGVYAYFFVTNIVGVGIISVFYGITGVSISSMWWVLVVGALANVFQGLAKEKIFWGERKTR